MAERASGRLALCALSLAALLAGCASGPGGGARSGRDGPGARPPADLAGIPDAEPRLEAIRGGGTSKPYTVLGRSYAPLDADAAYRESGLASWYGNKFHGASTANGERYDMYAMTAAHPTLPLPSYARVRNPANGREVIVRVNDRGPFHEGRIIDLSYTAAWKLDLLRGVAPVEVERITPAEIAAGSWRRDAPVLARAEPVPALAAAPVPAAVPVPPALQVPTALVAPAAFVPEAPPRVWVTDLPPLAPEPAASTATQAGPALVPAGAFWVQLGAFSRPEGASALAGRVGAARPAATVVVLPDGPLQRVQAGPFPSREAAREAAAQLGQALQLAPVVVERR